MIEVVMPVGKRALTILSAGVLTGLAASLMLTQFLQSQLWNVAPTDPATFAAVTL